MKVKGFTLIEMLVVLALTAMVSLLGFTVYKIFEKLFVSYSDDIEMIYDMQTITMKLDQDFNKAAFLRHYDPNTLILFDANNDTLAVYVNRQTEFIRNEIDTLELPPSITREFTQQGILLTDTIRNISYDFNLSPQARAKSINLMP